MTQLKHFIKSVSWALKGIKYAILNEQNFRIQLIIGVFVLFMAYIIDIEPWEMVIIVLMVAMVLVLELVNTIIELLVDMLKPRTHSIARTIKDVMAGAVLLTSITSIIIAFLIFTKYIHVYF